MLRYLIVCFTYLLFSLMPLSASMEDEVCSLNEGSSFHRLASQEVYGNDTCAVKESEIYNVLPLECHTPEVKDLPSTMGHKTYYSLYKEYIELPLFVASVGRAILSEPHNIEQALCKNFGVFFDVSCLLHTALLLEEYKKQPLEVSLGLTPTDSWRTWGNKVRGYFTDPFYGFAYLTHALASRLGSSSENVAIVTGGILDYLYPVAHILEAGSAIVDFVGLDSSKMKLATAATHIFNTSFSLIKGFLGSALLYKTFIKRETGEALANFKKMRIILLTTGFLAKGLMVLPSLYR